MDADADKTETTAMSHVLLDIRQHTQNRQRHKKPEPMAAFIAVNPFLKKFLKVCC